MRVDGRFVNTEVKRFNKARFIAHTFGYTHSVLLNSSIKERRKKT